MRQMVWQSIDVVDRPWLWVEGLPPNQCGILNYRLRLLFRWRCVLAVPAVVFGAWGCYCDRCRC